MRKKEKCILYLIAFAFFMICLGALLHLPQEMNANDAGLISRASSYVKFIGNNAGPIEPPKSKLSSMGNILFFSYRPYKTKRRRKGIIWVT